MESVFEKLSQPAQRALAQAGITTLDVLKNFTRADISAIHGVGPKAVAQLEDALRKSGKAFAGEDVDPVGAYIAQYPEEIQKKLTELRNAIREAAPGAGEKISWGMPTFTLNGNLVHFAANKKHVGFYPGANGVAQFAHKLTDYETSKGAIQFPLTTPQPLELVKEIVRFRVRENMELHEAKKR